MKKIKEKRSYIKSGRYVAQGVTKECMLCPYLEINGVRKCTHKQNFERVLSTKEKRVDKSHSTLCGFAVCCARGCPIYSETQYCKLFKKNK